MTAQDLKAFYTFFAQPGVAALFAVALVVLAIFAGIYFLAKQRPSWRPTNRRLEQPGRWASGKPPLPRGR